MKKSWFKVGTALCVAACLLMGCLGNNKEANVNEHSNTLKIMYDNEAYFYQQYGMLFNALYPNIEIEIVDSNVIHQSLMDQFDQDFEKALEAFIEQEKPDVILMDPSFVKPLIENKALYPLGSLVLEGNYNGQGLIPGALDYMKQIGEEEIYTLPTSFTSQVLYYNKDLFDEFGIPYPTDQMTWNEVFNLAKLFPIDGDPKERLFGLKMGWSNDISEIAYELSNAEGVSMFDDELLQMTMDTPAWASLIEQAEEMIQSNVLFYDEMKYNGSSYYEAEDEPYANDPFLTGKLAITFESNYYMSQIEDAQKYAKYPEDIVQRWDIVTAPVSSQQPDTTAYTYFNHLAAIHAASTNKDAAWTFISYITGDEYARVNSKVKYGNVVRTKYLEEDSERNYAAFYKLKPFNHNNISYYRIPQRFLLEFGVLFEQTLGEVTAGKLTIEHALAELQLKGNELLNTDYMSQEELEDYWKQNNDSIPGVISK